MTAAPIYQRISFLDPPPWPALEDSPIGEAAPMFMYMGTDLLSDTYWVHMFKHVNTRRYVMIDNHGAPVTAITDRYLPTSWPEAIRHVAT